MSKRILILTDSIAPPAYAPRVVSLVRYLSEQGCTCDVFSDRERGVEAFSAPFGNWHQTAYYHSGNPHWKYAADKLFGARERSFQAFIEATVDVSLYDSIFCSSCYYFPLQTTYRLANKYHKPYAVDLRDIAEQFGKHPYRTHSVSRWESLNEGIHRLFTARQLKIRNNVLASAQAVITISPWHRDLLSKYNPNTHLIYNGFDENEFYPQTIRADQFIISYAGKIYDLHFRDPRLLFEALQQILALGQMKREEVELRFHVDQASIEPVRQLAAQYRLEDICHVSGYISKDQLLPLLHASSVLLVLTCQSTPDGAHGIMGTKFYEALGVEKPVLCVRSDEECLAQVIAQTNAGLAGKNVTEVTAFLLDAYREWQHNGYTHQNIQDKPLFTRRYQSEQIAALL